MEQSRPSGRIVPVTKSNSTVLSDGGHGSTVRGLCCGTPGTVNLIDMAGNTISDFPLQQGYNPISVQKVLTSGSADDIWALY
jgi:hypothetical protein